MGLPCKILLAAYVLLWIAETRENDEKVRRELTVCMLEVGAALLVFSVIRLAAGPSRREGQAREIRLKRYEGGWLIITHILES